LPSPNDVIVMLFQKFSISDFTVQEKPHLATKKRWWSLGWFWASLP